MAARRCRLHRSARRRDRHGVVRHPVDPDHRGAGAPVVRVPAGGDSGAFEAFNGRSVELVDVSESPIAEVTLHGLRVGDREFELDSIVYATGFDAMTGALLSIDVRGRDGISLRDAWAAGPRTYL